MAPELTRVISLSRGKSTALRPRKDASSPISRNTSLKDEGWIPVPRGIPFQGFSVYKKLFVLLDQKGYKPERWLFAAKHRLWFMGLEPRIAFASKLTLHQRWVKVPGLLVEEGIGLTGKSYGSRRRAWRFLKVKNWGQTPDFEGLLSGTNNRKLQDCFSSTCSAVFYR